MKTIAILTNFTSYDKKYSLCNVAAEQIRMLERNNYKIKIIVNEGFIENTVGAIDTPDKRKEALGVYKEEYLHFIPNVRCYNELKRDDTWEEDIKKIADLLEPILKDVDTVFSHDLIYQPAYLKLNHAARLIAEKLPAIQWLHWIHSSTTPMVLHASADYLQTVKTAFPRSFVIYPNAYEIPRVAKNLGYEEDQVKVVPHATDPADFFGFHEITKKLTEDHNILSADVTGCYPLRLDRGKQPEKVLQIFVAIKKLGRKVRLVFCDFHSTGGDKVKYRQELKEMAIDLGMTSSEILFTSDIGPDTALGVPHAVVRDLMLISNLFILPSRSETYSLVAQEAGLCSNLLVLNFDFPPMRSIYGAMPLYAKFSSNIDVMTGQDGNTETKYQPSFMSYANDQAKRICYYLEQEKCVAMATFLRKNRNPQTIFKTHLEPLLYKEMKK